MHVTYSTAGEPSSTDHHRALGVLAQLIADADASESLLVICEEGGYTVTMEDKFGRYATERYVWDAERQKFRWVA